MSINDHPDKKEELQRLKYTKEYIQQVIGATEENKENYKENIKQAMEELDYLDSSLSYINILTNAKFLEMSEKDYRSLERIKEKPYFCRIDFKPAFSGDNEKLYIGKTSLYRREDHYPLIIDWRSPIANLYYEGRLGETTYKSEAGEFQGELSLKRQYIIENGELQEIQDIDITTRDELLQKSLSGSSDNRLQDIVSTIQAEQNQVIRADMDRPLIVQGVAGSGKTTIALHRISYFIYTYANNFNPESLMILAPNRLFINYISEALPELGVENITQNTYVDFCYECLGKKYKLLPTDEKMVAFIDEKLHGMDRDSLIWSSTFKGSLHFKDIVDEYIKELETTIIPKEDLMFDKYKIYSWKKIHHLFLEQYNYLPYFKRIDKIKKVLSETFKKKKKGIFEKLEEKYDEKIEQAMYGIKDPDKRRKVVVNWMNAKEKRMEELRHTSRTLINQYMKQITRKDLFDYYRELVTNDKLMQRLSSVSLDEDHVELLSKRSTKLLSEKKIEIEDTAALLFLKEKLFGLEEVSRIRNVVIDEAQDFSVFQLYALKHVLKTNLFTILGDISQGIHSYRGITDWKQVIDGVFPSSSYRTLQQSYRTTVEIMNVANQVIQQSDTSDILLAKPVVRHGEKPTYFTIQHEEMLEESIEDQVRRVQEEGYKTIAIIGKSIEDCKTIMKRLQKKTSLSVQLLKGEEEFEKVDVVVVPSYIVKGLEFDVVMIVNVDAEYRIEELDIKLLYVAMTRPLHRLYIYAKEDSMPILNNLSDELVNLVRL